MHEPASKKLSAPEPSNACRKKSARISARASSTPPKAARTYAADTSLSLSLSRTYVPESRLTSSERGAVWQSLSQLGPGQIGPVIERGEAFYVVQLLDRVPAGSEPELDWIEEDVRRQVAIGSRKQLLARQVQRLRTEAQARDELDVPEPEPEAAFPTDSTAAPADSAAATP